MKKSSEDYVLQARPSTAYECMHIGRSGLIFAFLMHAPARQTRPAKIHVDFLLLHVHAPLQSCLDLGWHHARTSVSRNPEDRLIA